MSRRAWELRQDGLSVREIAAELGCHHATVCRLLANVERQVLENLVEVAEAVKRRQIAELERLYEQAWAAWELSLEDAELHRVTTGKAALDPRQGKLFECPPEVVTEKKGQSGNPAMLAQARGAMADMRALLGLDAAPRKPVGDPTEAEPPVLIAGIDLERI